MKLDGIRVVDLTMFLPGPMLTLMMSDHGADVIRIEPPRGEPSRDMAPFVDGQSVWFRNTHRGKRSMVLDLKTPAGVEALKRLVATADVFVEAFRPGVVDRLGIGYEALNAVNPKLVYCSISAFGQDGPEAGHPAHDLAVEALAGVLALNDGADGRPVVPGVAAADMAGSLAALSAVLMALLKARSGGTGDYLDMSMFEPLLAWTPHINGSVFAEQVAPRSSQQRSLGGAAFYNVYETKDGQYVVLGGREAKFVKALLTALDRMDLYDMCTGPAGPAQDPAKAFLADTFRTRTRDEWTAWFHDKDVCFAPVLDLNESVRSPQAVARGMLVTDAHGVEHLASPLNFAREPARLDPHVPAMGEHTADILAELGYSDDQIAALTKRSSP